MTKTKKTAKKTTTPTPTPTPTPEKETVKAWHFAVIGADGHPVLRDGSRAAAVGEWMEFTGKVKICESGYHASRRVIDALSYAPYGILMACEVECQDIVEEHEDKFVCRRRRITRMVEATEPLRRFARKAALSVAHLWPDMPAETRRFLETGIL
jgi:hypothetical protein